VRSLIRLLVLIFAVSLPTAQAQLVPPGIEFSETEKLAENLYAFRYGPYRSLFMVTSEGVIVTDPQSPEAAEKYREAIASITQLPVKYVRAVERFSRMRGPPLLPRSVAWMSGGILLTLMSSHRISPLIRSTRLSWGGSPWTCFTLVPATVLA
jgi:hypothetical protein